MGETEREKILSILQTVCDPEIPVLSVIDLGIVRDIKMSGPDPARIEIVITPTYSGCPAMDVIKSSIRMELMANGYNAPEITTVLSPAWTTDWMSEKGKEKLTSFGIAPPASKQQVCDIRLFHAGEAVQCPRCQSYDTRLVSQFGSTPCKALHQCNHCQEPFDYFKCH